MQHFLHKKLKSEGMFTFARNVRKMGEKMSRAEREKKNAEGLIHSEAPRTQTSSPLQFRS